MVCVICFGSGQCGHAVFRCWRFIGSGFAQSCVAETVSAGADGMETFVTEFWDLETLETGTVVSNSVAATPETSVVKFGYETASSSLSGSSETVLFGLAQVTERL